MEGMGVVDGGRVGGREKAPQVRHDTRVWS